MEPFRSCTISCALPAPLKPDEPVAFLGGSNDDFFYWAHQGSLVTWMLSHTPLLYRALYEYRKPSTTQLLALERETALGSLALVGEQEASLRDAIRCARERGVRLWYFHDFLVLDLRGGRSPERTEMLERRRAVVQASGGDFVSLYDSLHEDAGVSWFNDQIHLSSVGHGRVADLICRSMTGRDGTVRVTDTLRESPTRTLPRIAGADAGRVADTGSSAEGTARVPAMAQRRSPHTTGSARRRSGCDPRGWSPFPERGTHAVAA